MKATLPDVLVWIAIFIIVKTGINFIVAKYPDTTMGQALGVLA